MRGTTIQATIKRVVDGDTIYVNEFSKSIRVLSLDTEESHAGGGKPVTPWGRKASERAKILLPQGSSVTLEFQGRDPADEVWERYIDNFGRGLAWVHINGSHDFQEVMIREGYSPYFSKYGYAEWPELHERYTEAERAAQTANIGVWNQAEVNGSEMRNYAILATWWELRAQLIEDYRVANRNNQGSSPLYNTRKDYTRLAELAQGGEVVTIFTELRSIRRVGGIHGLISIGSNEQPFGLFLPNLDSPGSQEIVELLSNRYLPAEDERYPRRGYCYVTGKLQLFRGTPQMNIDHPRAIRDRLHE